MTKEHVWPRWLHRLLSTSESEHGWRFTRPKAGVARGPMVYEVTERIKRGSRLNQNVRKVCQSCNSGWMSRLQTTAKPMVTALVTGAPYNLSPENQATLARWICMSTIVSDQIDYETAGVGGDVRRAFYLAGKPTAEWRIWVARFHGAEAEPRFSHDSFGIPPFDERAAIKLNAQATTVAIGQFFYYAVSIPDIGLLERFAAPLDVLVTPIWPVQSTTTMLPPESLEDRGFHWFADSLRAFLDEDGNLLPLPKPS